MTTTVRTTIRAVVTATDLVKVYGSGSLCTGNAITCANAAAPTTARVTSGQPRHREHDQQVEQGRPEALRRDGGQAPRVRAAPNPLGRCGTMWS
jgi:hypothetical protein